MKLTNFVLMLAMASARAQSKVSSAISHNFMYENVSEVAQPFELIRTIVSLQATEEDPRKPLQIGDHFSTTISSDVERSILKPVVSQDGKTSTYTLHHQDASYLSIHFSNMDLPPSCTLTVQDADGNQAYLMRGRGKFDLSTFWAHHVKGDTVDIVLHCNANKKSASFDIDDYVAGYPNGEGYSWSERDRHLRSSPIKEEGLPFALHESTRHLSLCGADDKRNAICYKDSHPNEYNKAKAVARLYINGSGACTGWLVSSGSLLFTNQHCIASTLDAQNTDFEFMGEEGVCTTTPGDGSWLGNRGPIFDGSKLEKVSATWDYALIQLVGNPATTYG